MFATSPARSVEELVPATLQSYMSYWGDQVAINGRAVPVFKPAQEEARFARMCRPALR